MYLSEIYIFTYVYFLKILFSLLLYILFDKYFDNVIW